MKTSDTTVIESNKEGLTRPLSFRIENMFLYDKNYLKEINKMFKKIIAYFREEKELMKRTEELHAETERILAEEEERKNNPVYQYSPTMFKFKDSEGVIHEVAMCSKEFDEFMNRKDVRLVFD